MATKLLNFLGKGVPQGARSPLFKNRGWINGQWVEAKERRYFPVANPANMELITEVINKCVQAQIIDYNLRYKYLHLYGPGASKVRAN